MNELLALDGIVLFGMYVMFILGVMFGWRQAKNHTARMEAKP